MSLAKNVSYAWCGSLLLGCTCPSCHHGGTEQEISSSVSPIFNQIYICTVHPITFGSVLFCSIPDVPGFPASPYSLHGGESMYMHTQKFLTAQPSASAIIVKDLILSYWLYFLLGSGSEWQKAEDPWICGISDVIHCSQFVIGGWTDSCC